MKKTIIFRKRNKSKTNTKTQEDTSDNITTQSKIDQEKVINYETRDRSQSDLTGLKVKRENDSSDDEAYV